MAKIAVLYAADRASAVTLLPVQQGELVAVYDGTAGGTVEKVSLAAREGRFEVLVLDTLATFNPKPMAALRAALGFHEIGIQVLSAAEPWLAASLPALRHGLEWILEQERVGRTSCRSARRREGEDRRTPPRAAT